jgi:hypothetical protein
VQDLAQLRHQTLAVRIGVLSFVSVMLAVVAAPNLTRQAEPQAHATIPLFKPYRANQLAPAISPGQPFAISAAE